MDTRNLVLLIIALLNLVLAIFIYRRARFHRNDRNPCEFLSTLAENLSSITDLHKMLASVTEHMTRFFNLQRMAVVLKNEATGRMAVSVHQGFGAESGEALVFDPDHPVAGYFNRAHAAVLIYDESDTARSLPAASVREEMEKLGLAVVLPLAWKDHLLGLLLLGPKQAGDIFTPEDLKLLEITARQAAASIENALLYSQVQRQMDELRTSQTQQLIQSAKLASIGELATNVAHEINNPLTSILGFTSLMIEEMGDEDPRKPDLKIVQGEAMRARDIVRNLLDFARKRSIKKEYADIPQLIQKTLNLLRHQAEVSNILLKENFSPDLPMIIVDTDQIKQVFINIVKNAFDAMPKGGTLSISTRAVGLDGPSPLGIRAAPSAGKMIEIRFEDTGVGIAEEHLPKIFDPFFTTKEGIGTGLGLAVSYGIIERHGGRIEVTSRPGEGTTFAVKLPIKEEAPMSP